MTTSRPIATITYNSPAFLLNHLQTLYDNGVISFWIYIQHKGEKDIDPDTGEVTHIDKDHIHLYIEPNKRIDTMALERELREMCPSNPTLPLKPQPFRTSNVSDWILYNLHDIEYLATKLETKEYHYTRDQFVTNDRDFLDTLVTEAYSTSAFALNKKRLQILRDPTKVAPAIQSGAIPLGMSSQVRAYQSIALEEYGYQRHIEDLEHRNELIEKAIDDMNNAEYEVYKAKEKLNKEIMR